MIQQRLGAPSARARLAGALKIQSRVFRLYPNDPNLAGRQPKPNPNRLIHIPFALLFFSSDSVTVFSESTVIVKLQSPDMQAAGSLAWTLPVAPEGVTLAGF